MKCKTFRIFTDINRNAFLNVSRLWKKYAVFALVCFAGALALTFSALLFYCAQMLTAMLDLPYPDYCIALSYSTGTDDKVYSAEIGDTGEYLLWMLPKFEIVEEAFSTQKYKQETKLFSYDSSYKKSENENNQLPWTVILESEYDDAFRKGERMLVKGRHLTAEDYYNDSNSVLIDEEMAKLNGLNIGSSFEISGGDLYNVAGIFRTISFNAEVKSSLDIPVNMIYSSGVPKEAESLHAMYNLYVKFKDGVTREKAGKLLENLKATGILGESVYNDFTLLPVNELNKISNEGLHDLFRISLYLCFAVSAITVIAISVFGTFMVRSRQKEIFLKRALGEKNSAVFLCFFTEFIITAIPSAVLGAAFCFVFMFGYLQKLFVYFANQISVENIHASSSIFIAETVRMSGNIEQNIGEKAVFAAAGIAVSVVLVASAVNLLYNCVKTKSVTIRL